MDAIPAQPANIKSLFQSAFLAPKSFHTQYSFAWAVGFFGGALAFLPASIFLPISTLLPTTP
jgi:hypothetical protein